MKRQGTGNRKQGTEDLVWLLRSALPPLKDDFVIARDLWPEVQQRVRAERAPGTARARVPWLDWALGFGLAALLALVPAWIPILLYCL